MNVSFNLASQTRHASIRWVHMHARAAMVGRELTVTSTLTNVWPYHAASLGLVLMFKGRTTVIA